MVASIENGPEMEHEHHASESVVAVQETSTEEPVVTSEKLNKLDSLLEKAGLYSSFLFSNMNTAATLATPAMKESIHDENEVEEPTEEPEPVNGKGKKKRTRVTKPKVPKEGVKKLKQMQEDTILDTRQQPKIDFQQPKLLTGGILRSYQLEGIRWLCNLFENGLNGILADEMGLGKTIQVIGLIAQLKSLGVKGPYLIVAPLSTLPNWMKEFQKWAPSINAFLYHGTKQERTLMRKQDISPSNKNEMHFPVIITSFEVILQDRTYFEKKGFVWKYIIIDEGHRLKNMNCKLVKELKKCQSENRLLLTGTPLQNNLTELWSLLNFILPDVFDDLDLFESWFMKTSSSSAGESVVEDTLNGHKKAEIVSKLHEILRPFLLRRLKNDVVKDIPSKTEIFIYCPMLPLQKEYYQMILDKTLAKELEKKYGGNLNDPCLKTQSIRNRAMQLRKCCNHPYLFDEPTNSNGQVVTDQRLVEASGKMKILDKMLYKLHQKGHKVLIFSQMTRVLDILEDYLIWKKFFYCRLDGSTGIKSRQEQMDQFNTDQNTFCFLLSTRAGGLGINLIAADTVIFFDSDWNPQQDNQAQDRCHRIGQTKEIVVYRLVTSNSFENRMIQRAIEKRKLERVVIGRGNYKQQQVNTTKQLTNEELQELMKDDILIRDAKESFSITDKELQDICDRQLVVDSFVHQKKKLKSKAKGYQVVDTSQFGIMESFA